MGCIMGIRRKEKKVKFLSHSGGKNGLLISWVFILLLFSSSKAGGVLSFTWRIFASSSLLLLSFFLSVFGGVG